MEFKKLLHLSHNLTEKGLLYYTIIIFGLAVSLVSLILSSYTLMFLSVGAVCILLLLIHIAYKTTIKMVEKHTGSFIAVEVKNNQIYFDSERTGMRILSGDDIKEIKCVKKLALPLLEIIIFCKDAQVFHVPDIPSRHSRLIVSMEEFAHKNGISLKHK